MGKLIVIEGLDGSGKATQTGLLESRLQLNGNIVRKVSFPDYASPSSTLVKMYLGGEFGNKPDGVNAYAASAFYAVDRYASYKKDWEEAYHSGIIIADRYTTSNAIHQCSKLPEDQWAAYLDWLFDFEYHKLCIPEPNLVVYLRVDPDVSQKLLKQRYHGDMSKEDIHEKDRSYLLHCQKAADYCSERLGWITIECTANGSMRTIDEIHADIIQMISNLL